jgi:uncharacterized membrane protein YqaE (UPF0057 family)
MDSIENRRGVFSDDFVFKVLLQEYVWLLVARWFLGFIYALWGVGKLIHGGNAPSKLVV